MKNKVTFASLACLLSLLAILVSCSSTPSAAPTAATGAATAASPKPQTTTAPSAASPTSAAKPAASPAAQLPGMTTPKYGGTFTTFSAAPPTNFDVGTKGQPGWGANNGLVYQQYMVYDWTKGPAGGGPPDYFLGAQSVEDLYGPQLAESWKMPSVGVWVLQIRKGMRWQKPDTEAGRLMNGREVTADDIVASLKRLLTQQGSWGLVAQPDEMKNTTVEKTGDWEVTITTKINPLLSWYWIVTGAGFNQLLPPDVVAKYGDVADWRNAIGTGPYILSDYTQGASVTYTKNPDYWETDPGGPGKGNKLPYIDTIKQLIIPDASTQLASFRTGKIDAYPLGANKEDAQSILKDNPQIINIRYLNVNTTTGISMRQDKKDLPFSDKRVRQALMLATDFNALNQTINGGEGEIDDWPVNKGNRFLYQPLSEMPQAVQDLYKYNPDKAKQLLADAGYPNGFKATINTWNDATLVDNLSLYKSMWAKVGIDLAITPMEIGAFNAMIVARSHDQLVYRNSQWSGTPGILFLGSYRGPNTFNSSYVDDPPGSQPEVEAIYNKLAADAFVNNQKMYDDYKAVKAILLDNAYVIPTPQPYIYNMWWPWVKNYFGSQLTFVKYAWIDQDLKKSMGK